MSRGLHSSSHSDKKEQGSIVRACSAVSPQSCVNKEPRHSNLARAVDREGLVQMDYGCRDPGLWFGQRFWSKRLEDVQQAGKTLSGDSLEREICMKNSEFFFVLFHCSFFDKFIDFSHIVWGFCRVKIVKKTSLI